MDMNINVVCEKNSELEKIYKISIPSSEIREQLIPLLQEKAANMKVPGFRTGNIPLQISYQQYGSESVHEAVRSILNQLSDQLVQGGTLARSMEYRIDTDIQDMSFEHLSDLEVHVTCIFFPTMPDMNWSSITLADYQVQPLDEEVSEYAHEQAQQHTTTVSIEESRPAQKGDIVVYTLSYEDQGEKETFQNALELGAERMPKELEEALEGREVGYELKERLRVPKNFSNKKLAGKKVNFTIHFDEIRKRVNCQFDEDFAKAQGFESTQAYIEQAKKDLETLGQKLNPLVQRKDIKEKLKEILNFPVAEELIQREFEHLWHHDKVAQKQYDSSEARAAAFQEVYGMDEEQRKEQLRTKALEQSRLGLLMRHIILQQNFPIEDKDWDEYVRGGAAHARVSVDQMIAYLKRNPHEVEAMRESILEAKALDWMIAQCMKDTRVINMKEMKSMI